MVNLLCMMLIAVSAISWLYSVLFAVVFPLIKSALTDLAVLLTGKGEFYCKVLMDNLVGSVMFNSFLDILANTLCFFMPVALFSKYKLGLSLEYSANMDGKLLKGIVPAFAFVNIASSAATQFCSEIGTFFFPALFSDKAIGGYTTVMSQNVGVFDLLVYFLSLCIITPFFEEFVFRGVIFGALRPYGKVLAVLGSGLMFGLVHGNISQFVYATIFGIMLAVVREKTGDLKSVIVLHFLNNTQSFIMVDLIPRFAGDKLAVSINVVVYFILGILAFFGMISLFSPETARCEEKTESTDKGKMLSPLFTIGFLMLVAMYIYRLFTYYV